VGGSRLGREKYSRKTNFHEDPPEGRKKGTVESQNDLKGGAEGLGPTRQEEKIARGRSGGVSSWLGGLPDKTFK